MNKTITTKKNAFEVNFFNKSIAGTKAAFNKASKGEGAHYEELTRLMAQHPDFRLVIKEQKIQKEKKETYEGLTFKLMKEYISIQKNSKALMEAFEEVKKFANPIPFVLILPHYRVIFSGLILNTTGNTTKGQGLMFSKILPLSLMNYAISPTAYRHPNSLRRRRQRNSQERFRLYPVGIIKRA